MPTTVCPANIDSEHTISNMGGEGGGGGGGGQWWIQEDRGWGYQYLFH